MNTFSQILRGLVFLVLAILGMAMAFVFMVSTIIAIAVLYTVAKIKGRPFGARAYWASRRSGGAQQRPFKSKDVIDVEMREIP